jgi:trans-2,3-dihydro-3-hydroxyanthranilate isomerase
VFYGGEDPATGSAAGCCAAWMVRYGLAAPGERVFIEQGLEVGRPGGLFVSAEHRAGGAIADVRVGGYVVEIARGEYAL